MTAGQRVFYEKIIKPRKPGESAPANLPCAHTRYHRSMWRQKNKIDIYTVSHTHAHTHIHTGTHTHTHTHIHIHTNTYSLNSRKIYSHMTLLSTGIQEMMELMRGMPASITASPLRAQQREGHNLPSAAVQASRHSVEFPFT